MNTCHNDGCMNMVLSKRKFCCHNCYSLNKKSKPSHMLGKKHSNETKQKIREAKLKQSKNSTYIEKLSKAHMGQKAWNKGKIYRKLKNCKRVICNNLINNYSNKYCSKECYLIDRSENNPMKNEETKIKVSKSLKGKLSKNKGRICSEETKQKIRKVRANQVFSEESRIKKSETMKKHWADKEFRESQLKNAYFKKGKEHPDWVDGSSFEPYGIEFNKELKDYIKNRDMYMCQTPNCMNTENLCIHHIDYDKLNNNPENLTTLCRSCHSKTNYNRDYYIEFYKNITTLYL